MDIETIDKHFREQFGMSDIVGGYIANLKEAKELIYEGKNNLPKFIYLEPNKEGYICRVYQKMKE